MTSNPIYFTVPNERGSPTGGDDEEDLPKGMLNGRSSRRNFMIFALLFSIVHASVDAVLAFSSAELGTKLGSSGGFTLYIFYTASALLLAKPALQWLGAKTAVLCGLIGMLAYVAMFLLAVLAPSMALYFFLFGAAVGGVGAGLLWTAQGSYYSANAAEYSALVDSNLTLVLTKFAGIFAVFYLSLEALFQFTATVVFVSSEGADVSWRPTVFTLYTSAAAAATALFLFLVPSFDDRDEDGRDAFPLTARDAFQRCLVVGKAICTQPKLQLILPFQICFGLSIGLVQTYVNGTIVKEHIGEGYIGVLAGITTLTAALLSLPLSAFSSIVEDGAYLLVLFGAVCFAAGGLMLITLSDEHIAYWPIIVTYYVVHGLARGVWENTNKALVAIFFPADDERDAAYAAVYFSSGLAGATGYVLFQFLSKRDIAIVNLSASLLALVCFHFGYQLHKRTSLEEALAYVHGITDTSRSNSDSSLDSLTEVVFRGERRAR